MIQWNKYFDRIICLHYLPMHDRVDRITQELKRVGILDSGIFEWSLSFDSPFYNILRKNVHFSDDCTYGLEDKRYGQFKCSYQHYEIMKKSLEIGYSNILILEDDVVFLKDLDKIQETLQNIPPYDIILFDKFSLQSNNINTCQDINKHFKMFSDKIKLFSSGCYSVDRQAMVNITISQEMEFTASDNVWNMNNIYIKHLSKAFSIINICRQFNFTIHNDIGFNENIAYKMCGVNTDIYQQYK